MCDLENRPRGLVLLFALVRGSFGVLHFVGEFEERVFNVFEAFGRRFAIATGAAYWRHGGGSGRSYRCSERRVGH